MASSKGQSAKQIWSVEAYVSSRYLFHALETVKQEDSPVAGRLRKVFSDEMDRNVPCG
jgi:hypothetical protein